MCHGIVDEAKCCETLQHPKFYEFLWFIDQDLAAQAQATDCPCGGKLHSARYPRKPRGAPRELLGPEYARRLSFCCEKDGCRRRTTPPSVRFLGRRVYLGAVVVLASAMTGAVTLSGAAVLQVLLGVSLRTLKRWRVWWRTTFLATTFWPLARSRFDRPVAISALPGSLLERFAGVDLAAKLGALLRFLLPLTTNAHGLRAF
ncbi:MAG: hypothetical protein ACREVA_05095 [Burkholderiales bacterium]